jgi:ribosome-associated translation inhibitor RaiA
MDVWIRWKGFTRSPAVEKHLARRLRFAIGRLADRVTAVRVWLEDVHGATNGVEKRCAIEILGAHGVRRAEAHAADLYLAVDRAAGVIGRSLGEVSGRPARHRPRFGT